MQQNVKLLSDVAVTLCHWSVMILDVDDSIQLPVLITTFRALEPNSAFLIAGPKAYNNSCFNVLIVYIRVLL